MLREKITALLGADTKAALVKVLCSPFVGNLLASIYRDRIPSGRLKVATDAASISPVTKAQIFWGIYESAEIRMIHRHLRRDLDLLEIGSSLGVVSSHARSQVSSGAKLVCVEANPNLISTIERNLKLNFPNGDTRVLNRAIDYESTSGTTRLSLNETTDGSRLQRLGGDRDGGEEGSPSDSVTVPASTVSGIVRECGLSRFSMICDIEGAEAGFVYASTNELEGCLQIIIELHDTEYAGRRLRWQDLADELRSRHGFRVVNAHGPVFVFER